MSWININPVTVKLKNALRIDRAVGFVWRAGPKLTIASAVLIVFQGVLPLVSLYLIKLIIDAVTALISASPGGASVPGGAIIQVFHDISHLLANSALYRATGLEEGFALVIIYIVLAGGAGLLTALCRFFAEYVKKSQALTVTDYMYSVLHEKSVAVDLAFYESPDLRDTLHRAQKEGPYRPTSIVNGLMMAGQSAASLAAVLGLLVMFNPLLPLVMFAAAVPGIVVRLQYSDRIYSWQKRRTEDERKANYFNWMLTGEAHAREFRLFGLGNHFIQRFKAIRDVLRDEKLWFEKRRAAGDLIAQASTIITVFGCFVYIALKTVQGVITIGDMVMYFQAFQKGLASLNSLLNGVASLYEDNLFLSNFYDFLDVKAKVVDPVDPVPMTTTTPTTTPTTTTTPMDNSSNNVKTDIPLQGRESICEQNVIKNQGKWVKNVLPNQFKADNVAFKYKNCEKNVIANLNFTINPGEVVALVGENGSGKSTLVKLMCRLYDPERGQITFNGRDIREYSIEAYRKKISVVFQDYIRYYLTVAENIQMGDIDMPGHGDRIEKAAAKAGIKKRIDTFPRGVDTPLGRWFKNGEELSAGQWQMIALARAFYRDAELVILDEPASSLDVNTEFDLFSRFKKLVRGKSALIISHRFSTVKMADRILLLHNGEIMENGSHDTLMALDGQYAALYKKQASHYTIHQCSF